MTKGRRKALAGLRSISGKQQLLRSLIRVISSSKHVLDTVMLVEREEDAGLDYYPAHPDLQRWTYDAGSAYT